MHYPGLQLLVFLCMWIPAFHCRPLVDQLRADAKILASTIIVRLEDHPSYVRDCSLKNLLPVNMKVRGLDFIPGDHPLDSLHSVDEVLEIFHNILTSMTINNMDQILTDLENLQQLLQTMISMLDCTAQKTVHRESLASLSEQYAKSPVTVEKVALDRFNKNLYNIVKHLEHSTGC